MTSRQWPTTARRRLATPRPGLTAQPWPTMRRWPIVLAVLAAAATVTACGTDSETAGAPVRSSAGTSAATGTTAPAAGIAIKDLGGKQALTDSAGRALYLFTKDTTGTSACTGDCLVKWPVLPGAVSAGAGVDATKIGTITRPDGGTQASYAGKPLYYFFGDKTPGDTAGQGANGVWFLIDATGEAIR